MKRSQLTLGARVVIIPKNARHDGFGNGDLADRLYRLRATVVKVPWFLAFHDVYHVGLFVDDGKHAEIEVDWCQQLEAVDALAELAHPPLAAKPWPPPRAPLTWWQRFTKWLVNAPR